MISRELGRGASGIVFLGEDPFAARQVAIKVYYPDRDLDERQRKLQRKFFYNEAHMAGKLVHPNILPIYDAGEEGELRYVVMAYLPDSTPLTKYTKPDNLLPLRKVVEIFFAMAKALDYAHRQGVVHRDIKPANVMMNPHGQIMIVDFGIAKTGQLQTTQIQGMVGTPRYMSPEQVRGEEVTSQSDIFSLGVMIYEMLTGMPPFQGESLPSLTHQILNVEPPPVNQLRVDMPDVLAKITMRCLRKQTSKRYKTGLDVAGDLAHVFDYLEEQAEEIAEQERFSMASQLAFFRDFSPNEVWEILRASVWKNYTDGQQIVTEGEIDDSFFIIVSGEVTVHKGKAVLGTLKEGDCFGEMGYLGKIKRTATIKAKGIVNLMKVNATLMETASRDCQLKFYQVFVKTLIERLARTNEKLLAAKL
ncbi:MAG TPA: serine/threonine-protein kinase [Gammaproteobacteria bacterium]|nr:serine/threonine-protein kinase [Gammaproteobacteria bacterium]